MLGGQVNFGRGTSSVMYASVGSGAPGAWTISPNQMPDADVNGAAVAYNGYLYVTGGWNAATVVTSSVFYAPINPDHSIGTWSVSPNQMPAPRYLHTAVVSNLGGAGGADIIVTGGAPGSGNVVFYAPINADHSVGSWGVSSNPMPWAVNFHGSVAVDNYIYVVGGNSNYLPTSTIIYAHDSDLTH